MDDKVEIKISKFVSGKKYSREFTVSYEFAKNALSIFSDQFILLEKFIENEVSDRRIDTDKRS